MPEAVLTLKMNPKTGERTLVINYESDPDALSYEHEDDHRAFVETLLGRPLSEVADRLEVKRAPPHPLTALGGASSAEANSAEEREGVSQGKEGGS